MLGTVALEGQRYGLKYLSTTEFFKSLEAAQEDSEIDVIKIQCATEEADKFIFRQPSNEE